MADLEQAFNTMFCEGITRKLTGLFYADDIVFMGDGEVGFL